MNIVTSALLQNEYWKDTIRRALRSRKLKPENPEREKPIATAHLPHVEGTTDKIGNGQRKH